MYLEFFGLREKPFSQTPDPRFLYWNDSYREALASLRYGIQERKGFLTMIGEAGTGKTTLLRKLLDDLGSDVLSVFLFNPNASFEEILEYMLGELGISAPSGRKLAMLQRLNEFLLAAYSEGRNTILLIDEAQDLEPGVLESLRLLSNLETSTDKILQIVLCGQPELAQRLAQDDLRQLKQRIAVRCRLEPLQIEELGGYIRARLEVAGGDPATFDPAAFDAIWEFSGGIPRLVNTVCDNALLFGYAVGKKRVDPAIVAEVIADLRRLDVPPPRIVAPTTTPPAEIAPMSAAAATEPAIPATPPAGLDAPRETAAGNSPPRTPPDAAAPRENPTDSAAVQEESRASTAVPSRVRPRLSNPAPPGHPVASPTRTGTNAGAGVASAMTKTDRPAPRAGAWLMPIAALGLLGLGALLATLLRRDRPEEPARDALRVENRPIASPRRTQPPVATATPEPAPMAAPNALGHESEEAAPASASGVSPASEPRGPVALDQTAPAKEAVEPGAGSSGVAPGAGPSATQPTGSPATGMTSGGSMPAPAAAPSPTPGADSRVVGVRFGDTLLDLQERVYGTRSYTLLDVLKAANTGIADVDRILEGAVITFPEPSPDRRLIRRPDSSYDVLVMTTPDAQEAERMLRKAQESAVRPVRSERAALGEQKPVFRILTGAFASEAEALAAARRLTPLVDGPSSR